MNQKNQTVITKDASNKKLFVVREFDAPVDQVWKAWTDRELLDQWWAPRPWKAVTVTMDFRIGGRWLYYMQGPDGSKQYCRVDYESVTPNKGFETVGGFCDENANVNTEFPRMNWKVQFSKSVSGTKVDVEVIFDSIEDLEKIVEMGFKEGFTMAHGNLDELLEEVKVP